MEQTINKIPIYEIFGPTIQGEGLHAGKRCMFVRVCGCNDRCSWCDSKFAWKIPPQEEWMTEEAIFEAIKDKGCNTVILTGGNPCIWDFAYFVALCHQASISVEVETQGGAHPVWLKYVDLITFSPKAPSAGSGALVRNHRDEFLDWLLSNESYMLEVVVKIPVFNESDIAFAKETFEMFRNEISIPNLHNIYFYLSVGNKDTKSEGLIHDRILKDYLALIETINNNPEGFEDVAILPQIHTLVWGNKGGV